MQEQRHCSVDHVNYELDPILLQLQVAVSQLPRTLESPVRINYIIISKRSSEKDDFYFSLNITKI